MRIDAASSSVEVDVLLIDICTWWLRWGTWLFCFAFKQLHWLPNILSHLQLQLKLATWNGNGLSLSGCIRTYLDGDWSAFSFAYTSLLKWRYATSNERKARARAITSNGMFMLEDGDDSGGIEVDTGNVVLLLRIVLEVTTVKLWEVGAIVRASVQRCLTRWSSKGGIRMNWFRCSTLDLVSNVQYHHTQPTAENQSSIACDSSANSQSKAQIEASSDQCSTHQSTATTDSSETNSPSGSSINSSQNAICCDIGDCRLRFEKRYQLRCDQQVVFSPLRDWQTNKETQEPGAPSQVYLHWLRQEVWLESGHPTTHEQLPRTPVWSRSCSTIWVPVRQLSRQNFH